MTYKSISILGCGWYGLPLAQELLKQNWQVKGSAQTSDKKNHLKTLGINAFQIHFSDSENFIETPFFESDVLLVNIPPKRRPDIIDHYAKIMSTLALFINESKTIRGLVFISSTSVYPDINQTVDETCSQKPTKDSGVALLNAENFLKQTLSIPVTTLRFSGLIGPGRHPSNFLTGKKDLKRGNAPVNLIHLDDCISATIATLNNELQVETYNLSSDFHPTRKKYYHDAATKAGVTPPQFSILEENTEAIGKIISNQKFKTEFPQWKLKHNDLS